MQEAQADSDGTVANQAGKAGPLRDNSKSVKSDSSSASNPAALLVTDIGQNADVN
jgi:hypothetical protein